MMGANKLLDPDKPSSFVEDFYKLWDKRIIGQSRAKFALGRALERLRSPYRKKDRPVFVEMLLGPSGVGKTSTAEVLAEYLYGNGNAFLKISGQDYNERHAVSKLIGSPPGYVGFIDPGEDLYGPYPLLSWWNVYRYDYEARYGEMSEEQDAGDATANVFRHRSEEISNEIWRAGLAESRWEERLETMIRMLDYLVALNKQIPSGDISGDKDNVFKVLAEASREMEKSMMRLIPLVNLNIQLAIPELLGLYEKNKDLFQKLDQLAADAEAHETERLKRILKEKKEERPDFEDVKHELTAVICIDEVEKAHPDFHNSLLEIMDRGVTTLGNGEKVSYANAIILLTSNAGGDEITKEVTGKGTAGYAVGVSGNDLEKNIYLRARASYRQAFSAAFRRRVDRVEVYRPLGFEDFKKIVRKQLLMEMQERLQSDPRIVLHALDPAIAEHVAGEAFDHPDEGVSVIQRKLKDLVFDGLDRLINRNEIVEYDVINVIFREGKVLYERLERLKDLPDKSLRGFVLKRHRKYIEEQFEELVKS